MVAKGILPQNAIHLGMVAKGTLPQNAIHQGIVAKGKLSQNAKHQGDQRNTASKFYTRTSRYGWLKEHCHKMLYSTSRWVG